MKFSNRGLAAVVACIMTVGVLPVVESDASMYYPSSMFDINTPPAGYEEFENTEMYRKYSEYFTPTHLMYYRSTKNPCYFAGYYYFDFSRVDIMITNDGWKEIYNKYNEVLNMDSAEVLSDDKTVRIMDYINLRDGTDYGDDSDAAIMERYNAIREKYSILKEMCKEMYEAGCIEAAEYRPFCGIGTRYDTFDFWVKGFAGSADELEKTVTDVYEYATIRAATVEGNYQIKVCTQSDSTAEDFFAVLDAVNAMDSDFEVGVELENFDESVYVPSLSSESVNLLTIIQKEAACDVDGSGTVDISDAVLILQHYAESAASGAATASETDMDVDSDGSITIDDATEVLGIYAQNAAGVMGS